MAAENPSTILLRGDPIASEGKATAAVTPGMALATAGSPISGGVDGRTVTPAGAGYVGPAFARENEIVGKGIDDAYAEDDNVLYYSPRKGDWIYALLTTGNNITAGDSLSCGAGGLLVKASAGTPGTTFASPVVARALETINNTSGEAARIKVEVA